MAAILFNDFCFDLDEAVEDAAIYANFPQELGQLHQITVQPNDLVLDQLFAKLEIVLKKEAAFS